MISHSPGAPQVSPFLLICKVLTFIPVYTSSKNKLASTDLRTGGWNVVCGFCWLWFAGRREPIPGRFTLHCIFKAFSFRK